MKRDLNHPDDYERLAAAEKRALVTWINAVMAPAYRVDTHATSYGMKHDFEEVGFYVTNGQFKGAMLACGYKPVDPAALNWRFRVKPRYRYSLRAPRAANDPVRYGLWGMPDDVRAGLAAAMDQARKGIRP